MSEINVENSADKNIEVKSDPTKVEEAERNSKLESNSKNIPEFNEDNRNRSNKIKNIKTYILFT
jgi:hypothetical protein